MLRELRAGARARLDRVPVTRPPVLRRSDAEDALLATDLPLVAETEAVAAFCAEMTALGWTVIPARGWLLLDAPLGATDTAGPAADLAGEVGCAISLLRRHPNDCYDARTARALVKAAEQGYGALEKVCGRLHGEWAQALRLGQPLPAALLPILNQAAKEAEL